MVEGNVTDGVEEEGINNDDFEQNWEIGKTVAG